MPRVGEFMASEKAPASGLVLDLRSFQVLRDGQQIKLEKTPMELLTLLVRRRGALVSREEIVHEIWGDAIHIDADAGINTAIRKIRQALEDNSAQPRYLETVVGKGYRFTGPIVVIDESATAPAGLSPIAERPRAWWGIRSALLAAALAGLLLLVMLPIRRNTVAASGDHQGRITIGVVPLRNLSDEPGQEYFVDGLNDEILTQLGQLNPGRLGVVRCASSVTSVGPRFDIGSKTAPQYLLEGSVRRERDLVRVSVRLVRKADGTSVWAESFDRQAGEVLSLQSEIAQRIGRTLQVRVLAGKQHQPARPEVVEAYLRGRFELNREDEVRDAARVYLERAIDLDPSYAPAYAGLADFYRKRAISDDAGSEEAWQLASRYAEQALSLDGESAETHAAIAQIKLMHDWDWAAAREHALRALQLNPSSPEAHSVYARYLRTAGKIGEAVSQREQALALDPFRPDLREQLGLERYFARDFQANVAIARQVLTKDPNNMSAHVGLCFNLRHLRSYEESAAECEKGLALVGHEDWAAAYLTEYRKHGYDAATSLLGRKQVNQILQRRRPDLWGLADAYALAGKQKEVMETLLRGVPVHEPGLLQVRVDPDFDLIRNDPRYAELLSRIAFPSK